MDCRSGRLYASREDAPESAQPFLKEVSNEGLTPRAKRRMKEEFSHERRICYMPVYCINRHR